jgi:hypothetical protein
MLGSQPEVNSGSRQACSVRFLESQPASAEAVLPPESSGEFWDYAFVISESSHSAAVSRLKASLNVQNQFRDYGGPNISTR